MVKTHRTDECKKCGKNDFTNRKNAKQHKRMPVGNTLPKGLIFVDYIHLQGFHFVEYKIVDQFREICPSDHRRLYKTLNLKVNQRFWQKDLNYVTGKEFLFGCYQVSAEDLNKNLAEGRINLLTNDEVFDFLHLIGGDPFFINNSVDQMGIKYLMFSKDGTLNNLGRINNIERILRGGG